MPERSTIPADKDTRKKVMYFYLHYDQAGPQYNEYEYRFLETLCKAYKVLVVFFTKGQDNPDEGIAPKNVNMLWVRDPPFPKRLPALIRWPLETVSRSLLVAALVRIIQPNVVVGNWITRSSGLYCAIARVHPLVVLVWGSDVLVEPRRSRLLRAFGRFTVGIADAVILDSLVQEKAAIDIGCNPSKIHRFPWGIDLDRFRPGEPSRMRTELGWLDSKIVVSTRWQDSVYGVEYLIRAIPSISNRIRDARFLIVGGGPLLDYHKNLAGRLGVNDRVRFLGTIPNTMLPAILNTADVYVSTSFSDGTSASLMEAIACGLPVVVTDIPGNREWITQGENGLLVQPGDSRTLADGVSRILTDGELRERMRSANFKLAKERADWNTNSLVLQKCILNLLR